MARKILYTASTYSHLRNFHRPYLERFREEGWTVHTAAAGDPEGLPEADRAVVLPFAKRMTALDNFRCAGELGRMVKSEGYELVVANTSLAAFFTRLPLLGMRERPKVVNISHGYLFGADTPAPKRRLLLDAERLTARCTDLLLTMNGEDHEIALRYGLGAEVLSIPGVGVDFRRIDGAAPSAGWDLRHRLGIPEDGFLMVYLAEFSERKNQAMLIRALAALPRRAYLLLAGQGAELERCRALAGTLGVEDRVRFPGYMEPGPCLRAADCAVSSSRSEGLPFNIVEAMRAGLPILASDVKGHRDLLGGGAGVLYAFGDEAAFAGQVRRLMDDAALRESLGAAAAAAAEDYGLERVLPQVMAALGRVVPITAG